jgi:integrase
MLRLLNTFKYTVTGVRVAKEVQCKLQAKFKPRPHLIQEGKSDEELFEIFLDLCERNLATEANRKYARVIKNFQQYLKAHNLKITDVRSETADAWLAQWKSKPAAKQQYAIILQRFLGFLGILDPRNGVFVDVPVKRKNLIEEIRRQLITKEDLKAYLTACRDDLRAALLGAILWETGLRANEVASLRWKHVSTEEGLIEVPKRKGGMKDSVPFGTFTLTYLRLREFSGHDPEDPLIESQTRTHRGQPLSEDGIYYVVNKYGKLAGWRKEQCHPHAFRHSCATHLIKGRTPKDRGVNPAVVQEILNHSSITTTMIYTHLAEDDVISEYRRVMRPDWKPPVEEEPAKPELCPKCSMQRLPGYITCPACGFNFNKSKQLKEEDLLRDKIHKMVVAELLRLRSMSEEELLESAKTDDLYNDEEDLQEY